MKKFKFGNYQVTVEPIPPDLGVPYHHKDRDPEDMIKYVLPRSIKAGTVTYLKVYKDIVGVPSGQTETISITEFNRWFRKGE